MQKRTNFRWVIVFLLFILLIFNFIDRAATSFVLEYFHKEFCFSDTQLGIIMGSYSIGFIITAFLGGIFLDKIGPKLIFTIIVFIWLISMISMALATGFILLLLSRVLLGLAGGPIFPALTIATSKWLPINERTTSLSFVMVASTIGIVLSGPLVTFLVYYFSWRGMFVILSLISLLWIPIWLYFFHNNPKESKYVNDLELNYINNLHYNSSTIINKAYTKKEIIFNTINNITVISNIFAYIVFCFFFYFFISWLPTYFSRFLSISILDQGVVIMIIWGLASLFMFGSGSLFDYVYKKTNKLRYVRSYPIIISSLIPAICILILILNHVSVNTNIALIALSVSCLMISAPIYYAVNLDIVKVGTGFALGVMEASSFIAGFFAPVITGYIIDITKSFNSIFIFLIILAFINIVIIYFFHKPDNYKVHNNN